MAARGLFVPTATLRLGNFVGLNETDKIVNLSRMCGGNGPSNPKFRYRFALYEWYSERGRDTHPQTVGATEGDEVGDCVGEEDTNAGVMSIEYDPREA